MRMYWLMVNGRCVERTQNKRLAFLSAHVYARNDKNAIVHMEVVKDYCVPTVDNRVDEECVYGLTPKSAWEIAESLRFC